jgi:GH15 family glucan-1,4-alpha-glucosidase
MDAYPPIAAHGLIGDLQTAALVADDGTVDWFCAPRFDSPSIFASLLDHEKGGYLRICPQGTEYVTKQLYLPGTPILITRFLSNDGVGEVVDFMPVTGDRATDRHRLVRIVRVVRGQMSFLMECQPRFNYGRDCHEVIIHGDGVAFRSRTVNMNISSARPGSGRRPDGIRLDGKGVSVVGRLSAGQLAGMVLETEPEGPPRAVTPDGIMRLYDETRDFWRRWIGRSHYQGRWREVVERSAIALKLMTYAPSGAMVAAPTAGLPEQIGGERNWDYRYTWIRDASFSIHALLGLGFLDEAQAFLGWLRERVDEASQKDTMLQVMYRVDGSADLHEEVLDHFEGYKGSRPVRIGNGAAGQLQLDIYGEVIDSIYLADQYQLEMGYDGWRHLTEVVDRLCEMWDQPDDGIWETRGGRRHYVYSRVMSWVAFDRAIRLAASRGRPADVRRWADNRDAVYRQVMDRGWNAREEAFVQHYGSNVLDAALLALPMVDFVSPSDPLWQSTLDAIDRHLVSDSLVYRYDPVASPDGLRGSEGTFSMCTFWYVDALTRSGRLDDARLVFDKMLTYSNHAGLFAEEIGPTGEQLGNFPQAFSHMALIKAAVNLSHHIEKWS